MDNDDAIVGRLLSRREVLALFGVAGAALVVGCSDDDGGSKSPTAAASNTAATATSAAQASASATGSVPSCIVRPELTEGPYFVDEKLNRSDIRSDPSDGSVKAGVPLAITFLVSSVGDSCVPLAGATVDVWHCDALGVYSDVTDNSEGFNTVGQKFLRGYQVTDADGKAEFTTIYPGWYQGRATHIHFKIRTDNGGGSGYEFTSQFFFDDALSDEINALAPYSEKGASGRLQNSEDNIYGQSNGQLLLALAKSGDGYATTFDIGLQTA